MDLNTDTDYVVTNPEWSGSPSDGLEVGDTVRLYRAEPDADGDVGVERRRPAGSEEWEGVWGYIFPSGLAPVPVPEPPKAEIVEVPGRVEVTTVTLRDGVEVGRETRAEPAGTKRVVVLRMTLQEARDVRRVLADARPAVLPGTTAPFNALDNLYPF